MTRINAGIPPAELVDKHLLAEHREIKRIPNTIKKGRYNMIGKPDEFVLGPGHVKFFYDKLQYLWNRYHALHEECKRRGFNVTYYGEAWAGVPQELMNDWVPTEEARALIRARIQERLNAMK